MKFENTLRAASLRELHANREKYADHLTGMSLSSEIIRYFGIECFYDSPLSGIVFTSRRRTVRMRLFNKILARQFFDAGIPEKWFWQDVSFHGVEEFSGKMFYEQPSKIFYALSEVVSENEGLVNMKIYFRSNKEFLKRMSCLKISFRSINISLRSGYPLEENEVNLWFSIVFCRKNCGSGWLNRFC